MGVGTRIKLFHVVFVFTTAIVLVSSITVSAIIYDRLHAAIVKQNEDTIRNTTAQLKSNILKLVDNCVTIAGNMYGDFALQSLLQGSRQPQIDYDIFERFNLVTSNIHSIKSNNQEIGSISIYTMDAGLSNGKEIKLRNQFRRPDLLQKAMDAKGADLWVSYQDASTGNNLIALMKYLNMYAPGGVLVIEVNERSFYELYKAEVANNYLFLLDDSDRVLSSSVRYAIGKPIERYVSEAEGIGRQVYDGKRYFSYSDKVNDSWSLNVLYDSNEIEKEKRNITYYIIFVTGILIAGSTLLTLLFSRRYSLQIGKLVRKIREIDRGNLAIKPTVRQIHEFYLLDQALCAMANNIDSLSHDILKVQKQKEESEIKYLQMQMNPHFLYNLLSAIRWIAYRSDQKQITHIIDLLGDFYKIALSKGNEIIGIQDELKLVRNYVELQDLCYNDPIRLSVHLDEDLNDLKVCKMTLQPFVENAILHGHIHGRELLISIDIIRYGEAGVRIRIADNGAGIGEQFVRLIACLNEANAWTNGASYGVSNTVARLKYMYGNRVRILAARQNPGTLIEIIIQNVS